MTAYDPNFAASENVNARGRRSRIWQWLGRGNATAEADAPPTLRAAPPLRDFRMEIRNPLLDDIGEFLVLCGLETIPFTLQIAYECVSGYSPRLMEQIRERRESGDPVTVTWLEDVSRETGRMREDTALASLMTKLEEGLDEFGKTTNSAKTAATEYNSALKQHVDDLEEVNKAGEVISELAALTRAMMERTRLIENELDRSEKRALSLQRNLEDTRRLADNDHLTGLPNRRAFEHLLETEYVAAKTAGEPLCVAFCDIDKFKLINDTHGHAAGDRVLKVVAETLSRISDDRCHVARHGGEEFAVLFRGLTLEQAFARLETAREDIADRKLVNRATDVPFGRVSFSGGLADVYAHRTQSAALKAADDALYRAKAEGRNRVLMAAA